jgi:hypothetical protein
MAQQSSEIGDDRPIAGCEFSPDGSLLATCGEWSGVESGKEGRKNADAFWDQHCWMLDAAAAVLSCHHPPSGLTAVHTLLVSKATCAHSFLMAAFPVILQVGAGHSACGQWARAASSAGPCVRMRSGVQASHGTQQQAVIQSRTHSAWQLPQLMAQHASSLLQVWWDGCELGWQGYAVHQPSLCICGKQSMQGNVDADSCMLAAGAAQASWHASWRVIQTA